MLLASSCGMLSLLNSGTTHLKYTNSDTTFEDVHYENSEKFGDISFSIRNIQHPKKYGDWDLNVRLRPSLHFDKERYRVKKDQDSLDRDFSEFPEIQIRRLLGFANLKLSAHTPVGAFALTGGLGGALSERRDDGIYRGRSSKLISKVDLVWIAFLSERFYVMLGPRYYREDYEQFVFALRLGYFWSDPYSS